MWGTLPERGVRDGLRSGDEVTNRLAIVRKDADKESFGMEDQEVTSLDMSYWSFLLDI